MGKTFEEAGVSLAELLIREQYVGDAVVLHLKGRITIGEGSVTLRHAVHTLLEQGNKKFVLNMSAVKYVDSSGRGEIVSAYTTINVHGGKLVFCQLTQRMRVEFTITKLLTVFNVYEDVNGALAALSVPHKFFRCPLADCKLPVTFQNGRAGMRLPSCSACEAQFEMALLPADSSKSSKAIIRSFRIPTYQGEHIKATIGSPSVIEIIGRLDLFVSEILRRARQTIPAPARVIFDISETTEISRHGLEALHELCLSDEVDAAAVILTSSQTPETFKTSILVY